MTIKLLVVGHRVVCLAGDISRGQRRSSNGINWRWLPLNQIFNSFFCVFALNLARCGEPLNSENDKSRNSQRFFSSISSASREFGLSFINNAVGRSQRKTIFHPRKWEMIFCSSLLADVLPNFWPAKQTNANPRKIDRFPSFLREPCLWVCLRCASCYFRIKINKDLRRVFFLRVGEGGELQSRGGLMNF